MVEARAVTKVYHIGGQAVTALNGIDLALRPGEFVSVMGRSGSGKSTLLHILGCLDRPTAGRVILGGVEVSGLPASQLPALRRSKVGFVFQQHNLLPSLTALENVTLPLRYSRTTPAAARRRALALLQEVGLEARLGHRPAQLSGGERQRVALARALVHEPKLVLADEPTGELDSQTAAQMIGLMRGLNQRRGQTFLIVTHDPAIAAGTDRTIHVLDGRIVEQSPVLQ